LAKLCGRPRRPGPMAPESAPAFSLLTVPPAIDTPAPSSILRGIRRWSAFHPHCCIQGRYDSPRAPPACGRSCTFLGDGLGMEHGSSWPSRPTARSATTAAHLKEEATNGA
jgi:hypothetical protein